MERKKLNLSCDTLNALEKLGARIHRARLRRNISVKNLVEKAGISESTFYAIEIGAYTVSIGAYVAVFAVLEMEQDIEMVAVDEAGKRKYPRQSFKQRERVSRKKS